LPDQPAAPFFGGRIYHFRRCNAAQVKAAGGSQFFDKDSVQHRLLFPKTMHQYILRNQY